MVEEIFIFMPRGRLTKDEIKTWVLKCKKELVEDPIYYSTDPKQLAHKYLNKVLEKIDEFAN